MKQRRLFKQISRILIIAMVFTYLSPVLSTTVFSEGEDLDSLTINQDVGESVSSDSNQQSEANIIGELTDKREKNVKHFLKDDMTYEAAVYPSAVHYFDDGKWRILIIP